MVSKASDDLPEPETPVMTTNLLGGMTTSMFLRLCSRAPRMTMESMVGRNLTVSTEGRFPGILVGRRRPRRRAAARRRRPTESRLRRRELVLRAEVLRQIRDH